MAGPDRSLALHHAAYTRLPTLNRFGVVGLFGVVSLLISIVAKDIFVVLLPLFGKGVLAVNFVDDLACLANACLMFLRIA